MQLSYNLPNYKQSMTTCTSSKALENKCKNLQTDVRKNEHNRQTDRRQNYL